jgi:adenylate cyclase
MSVSTVLAVVFGVVATLSAVAVLVLAILLRRTRHRLADLERSLRPIPRTGPVETVGRVARTVIERASRLREHGLGYLLSSSIDELTQWAKADRERIARVADKDGTVTLFFSDITDSTALNEELGDTDWVRVLAAHDALVRREIEQRDGVVVKTIGDGVMAVFGRADAAILAALAIHDGLRSGRGRRLRRTPLTVRIGIHTGTAISSGDDYLGRNVALCARIAAHARSGQTLVSIDTESAAADAGGIVFSDRERVTFKGIAEQIDVATVTRTVAPATVG